MPHFPLPLRRALAAVAGAIAALVGLAVTQLARHKGGLVSDRLEDRVLMASVFIVPVVVAFLLTLAITRWKPGIKSGALASIVTLASYYAGSVSAMAIAGWSMGHTDWPKAFIIGAVAMIFGVFVIGPWSLIAGWATFFYLDRRVSRSD